MKQIVLTTFILFVLLHNCLCQQPTKAEIDKLMKDAKAMLAQFQQPTKDTLLQNRASKIRTATKPVTQIMTILLKQPLQIPTEAQAKDKLLWYKGKKLNDSMIVTTKGMLVLYSRKKLRVTAQPLQKSDPFRSLVGNLSKTAQMTDDYINEEAARKNSPMNYPLIQGTVDEFEEIDDQLNAIVKNTIDLPSPPATQAASVKPGNDAGRKLSPKETLKEMQRQIEELIHKDPGMQIDPPPKKEFSLEYSCDKNAANLYREERKKWADNFLQYEDELIRLALKINQYAQSEEGVKALKETGSDSVTIEADIQLALGRAISRSDQKMKSLVAQNGKNLFMQESVITSVLAYERKKQLLGLDNETDLMGTALALFNSGDFENYINDEMNKKNWDVVFNLAITLGRVRQTALFGIESESTKLLQIIERVRKLNRFALTVDIDFNMQLTDAGKPSLKASGELHTTDKVYVCLARAGCKWTLLLCEPDLRNAKEADYYIPLQVTAGIKSVKDDKGKWTDYSYSGPRDMLLHFPVIRIDFSDGGQQDSATLGMARYPPNTDFTAASSLAYTTDLLSYINFMFLDVSKVGDGNVLLDVAKDMMARFAPLTSMQPGTPLEKLKQGYLVNLQKQEGEQKTAAASSTPKVVMLFNALRNSSVLIDDIVDTKHKDNDVEVTKGLIKLKVIHDPLDN